MKELSSVASAVKASTTLAVDAMAKKMRAEGLDVIGFGTGEPDFDTPKNIRKSAVRALLEGKTRYTPANGIISLREAICKRLAADLNVSYEPAQITVASGAKHSVYIALKALVNPGDEVILPAPYWVTYYEAVRMVGGVPVVIDAPESANFKITPDQLRNAIGPKTKLFLINNPSNPTGMLYTGTELEELLNICVAHDLYILADEIYCALVYGDGKFVSAASLGEEIKKRTILINGVSKSYAMTGWRIGYAAASPEISKVMTNYLSHSTGAPSTISQYAAREALNGSQDSVEAMRKVFDQRRQVMVQRIGEMEGVSCLEPQGAFYVMMNIEKQKGRTLGGRLIRNGDDFALAFLETAQVAAVPCSGFGAPDFLRFTYAASIDDIGRGLDRLEKFLNG